jgi:hypothetical protein
MSFDGVTDRYASASNVSTLTDNFGVEAWVRSSGDTDNAVVAYNGNTALGGWGLFRLGGTWTYLYGGVVVPVGVPVQPNVWTHLAVVRDNGITRFYVNGVQFGADDPSAPMVPEPGFAIGGNPEADVELFDGLIDEVRVFTFQPGRFAVTDLNINAPAVAAAPVPATGFTALALLLTALTILGLRASA